MNDKTITIAVSIKANELTSVTDQYLAQIWVLAQLNPAPFGDEEACLFTEKVGREIIRRFLANNPPDLWNHQAIHVATEMRIANQAAEQKGGA